MEAPLICVGYDPRQHSAWEVCRKSILRRASGAVRIVRIEEPVLREMGLYSRQWHTLENGQRIDDLDGRPFSTDFSFTRFLVPALALYQGWALYCDCDFLFTADISALFALVDDRYAVMCVKHEHEPSEAVKMDGVSQARYHRKNWSSLVLFNAGHLANRPLSPNYVNSVPGQFLHAFDWLPDHLIGDLPYKWNWLSGVNEQPETVPCGIHFTLGIPEMPGYENAPYADLWRAERDSRRGIGPGPLPTERYRALELTK